MFHSLKILSFTFLANFMTVECSKILALMAVPSHSHHHWNIVYLEALARRGHHVTYLGVDHYKNPPPNITHIYLENAYNIYEDINFEDVPNHGPYQSWMELMDWFNVEAKTVTQQEGMKKFLSVIQTEKFDLVVYDLGNIPFLLGCIDVLGRPPVIGITAFGVPSWALDTTATPYPIAISPHFTYPLGRTLNYAERLENSAFFMFAAFYRKYYLLTEQEKISKETFGKRIRTLEEIEADMNINMVNANWATDNAFPISPGLIPIGGLHIKEPKGLPQDLKDFLDSSKEGVVYVSFGSNVQSSQLGVKAREALVEAFRNVSPLQILWKWEAGELPGKPENVKIEKWMPQNDILAHPNIKLFITHGGMLSTQEAVYHGVPILGIPFFVDQHVNVMRAVSSGLGEVILYNQLQSDLITSIIQKIIKNKRYKATAVRLSRIFLDNINSPLDRAVFYTEYAIRHNGAQHLKPPSSKLSWFQSGLYDILLTYLGALLLFLYGFYKVLESIGKLLFRKEKVKEH